MSVSFGKTGIVDASGIQVGENLARNSSLSKDLNLWSKSGVWDFTNKDGYDCIHNTGALQTTANMGIPSTIEITSNNTFTPYSGLTLTLSCDVLFENVVRGTTNYYVTIYKSGQTIAGTWRVPNIVGKSEHFTSDYLDQSKLNGKGWQRIWITIQFGDYAWFSGYRFSLYARDYTGDTYWRNLKIEYRSSPTPWIPNNVDNEHIPLSHAFVEDKKNMSIYKNYVQTTEFIEW